MGAPATYDAHADWYDDYLTGAAHSYTLRVQSALAELLGPGSGACLDVCCGTGAHAQTVRELGWTPLGLDVSRGQLRHAAPRLPIAAADATRLPIADRSVPAAVCVLAHTDMPAYPDALREIARVLRPGGRFVHLGVHPCFVGAFADWSARPSVAITQRYAEESHSFDAWCPGGVRARLGAWHLPLAGLLNGITAAGLVIVRTVEGPSGGVPDIFGILTEVPVRPRSTLR